MTERKNNMIDNDCMNHLLNRVHSIFEFEVGYSNLNLIHKVIKNRKFPIFKVLFLARDLNFMIYVSQYH